MAKRRIAPHRIGQIIATVILNGYILAYVQGKILYSGFLKSVPEPVLNCYGGPLSVFACPLGSFQQILGQQGVLWWQRVPWVIVGLFVIVGAFVGRAACGWVCPFGLWQDLLYKIKLGKRAGQNRWVSFGVVTGIGLIAVALLALFVKVAVWKSLLFGWLPFVGLYLFSLYRGKLTLPPRWWLGSMLVGIGVGLLIGVKFEVNLGIAVGVVALTGFSLMGGNRVVLIAAPLVFVLALLGKPITIGNLGGVELGLILVLGVVVLIGLFDFLLKVSLPVTTLKFVFFLLVAGVVAFFTGEPWFCKLCPQGTLEAGVPLVVWDPVQGLRSLVGWLFYLKVAILLFVFWAAIVIKRPFCRVVCPIGAIYSLFNRASLMRMKLDTTTCTRCAVCRRVCPMDIEPYEEPNQAECIRCFECVWACPKSSLRITT